MRTTLTLSEEAAQFATRYANAHALRMGEAVSELILQTNQAKRAAAFKRIHGIAVFAPTKGVKKVGSADVRALFEDSL